VSARRVWVISPFAAVPPPETPDRYAFICHELERRGAEVTQFVSIFDHHLKTRRAPLAPPWRCVRVFEPGYRSNISYGRIASHIVFDAALPAYMFTEAILRGRPDAILAAVPHNVGAVLAVEFARLVGAVSIVDVHDTWPESLLGVTTVQGLRSLLFSAWKQVADLAYRRADRVFAESGRYAGRANGVRLPAGLPPANAIYLGGDLAYYGDIPPAAELPVEIRGSGFLVAYVGSMGRNYDLDCVVDAFAKLASDRSDSALMLLGAGEREGELRERLRVLGARSWVSGRIPHADLVSFLKHAHVGLNAFRAGGNVAYSYKLNDYLLTGIPVVNSLPGESADLIRANGLGYSYDAGNVGSLYAALRACERQWQAEPNWRSRVLAFAATELDRRVSYQPLIDACLGAAPGTACKSAP